MNKKATNNISNSSRQRWFLLGFIRYFRSLGIAFECTFFEWNVDHLGKSVKTEENVNNWNMLCAVWCFRGVIIGHDEMANNNAQRIGICDRFILIHSQSIYFVHMRAHAHPIQKDNKQTIEMIGRSCTHSLAGWYWIYLHCLYCSLRDTCQYWLDLVCNRTLFLFLGKMKIKPAKILRLWPFFVFALLLRMNHWNGKSFQLANMWFWGRSVYKIQENHKNKKKNYTTKNITILSIWNA